jgi:hypothetical protein
MSTEPGRLPGPYRKKPGQGRCTRKRAVRARVVVVGSYPCCLLSTRSLSPSSTRGVGRYHYHHAPTTAGELPGNAPRPNYLTLPPHTAPLRYTLPKPNPVRARPPRCLALASPTRLPVPPFDSPRLSLSSLSQFTPSFQRRAAPRHRPHSFLIPKPQLRFSPPAPRFSPQTADSSDAAAR